MHRIQSKQQGQGLSEYLVIVGLIAVASIVAVGFLGGTVRSQVAAVANEIAESKTIWEECKNKNLTYEY
jgi:pilus assembly protein Flp/PilA